MSHRPAAFLLVLPLLLAGCVTTPSATRPMVVTTLYFGLSKPDGSLVSPGDWQNFVDTDIARNISAGFTVLSGDGGWQSRGKTEHEPCRVVIIVRPDAADLDAAIDTLRVIYCDRFQQESVLRVDQAAGRVSF